MPLRYRAFLACIGALVLFCVALQGFFIPLLAIELVTTWAFPLPLVVSVSACGVAALVCIEVAAWHLARLTSRAAHSTLFDVSSLTTVARMRRAILAAAGLSAFGITVFHIGAPAGHLVVSVVLTLSVAVPLAAWLCLSICADLLGEAIADRTELAGVI